MADTLPFDPTAPKQLPKPGPRRPLSKHEYAELFLAQMGKCFRCSARLVQGNVIDEHMVPRESLPANTCDDLDNRKLFCKPCAKAKTVGDAATVAKTRRLTGGRGSQYEKRKERGGSMIKSRGFSTPLIATRESRAPDAAANGGKRMQSRPFAKPPEGFKHKWGKR